MRLNRPAATAAAVGVHCELERRAYRQRSVDEVEIGNRGHVLAEGSLEYDSELKGRV